FGLHFSLFRRLGDVGCNPHRHLWMHHDPYGVEPEVLDRPFKNDLAFFDREPCSADRLGDISSGNRAIQLSAFARLADQDDAQALELIPISVASDLRCRLFASSWARWLSK